MRIPLPSDPTIASFARRAVKEACAGVTVDLDALILCTSELVTNALLHADPPMELEVSVRGSWLRVAVHDSGTNMVQRRSRVPPDALSGRGLDIVEMLASGWGGDATPAGKVIWFEMATDD
ncbi:MAG: ATP-binding protein [Actinobacteria bacterium]|nr:ATP-binding protein [Actinomycetota bacterium]MBW3650004.1 ATP-binding protein [Actinomycetota bacterium]